MATVGELLKSSRIAQNITLSQVEQATKIRVSFLKNLEEGDYQLLPSSAYARGFIKNYAEFLGLSVEPLLARLRRELHDYPRSSKHPSLLPQGVHSELASPRFRVTGIFLLVTVLIAGLFLYLLFQYRGFLGSPTLTIDTPGQHEVVRGTAITVVGKTDPDTTVKINNEFVEVLSDGKFQKTLTLFKGTFTLSITAINRFGRQSITTRTITIE